MSKKPLIVHFYPDTCINTTLSLEELCKIAQNLTNNHNITARVVLTHTLFREWTKIIHPKVPKNQWDTDKLFEENFLTCSPEKLINDFKDVLLLPEHPTPIGYTFLNALATTRYRTGNAVSYTPTMRAELQAWYVELLTTGGVGKNSDVLKPQAPFDALNWAMTDAGEISVFQQLLKKEAALEADINLFLTVDNNALAAANILFENQQLLYNSASPVLQKLSYLEGNETKLAKNFATLTKETVLRALGKQAIIEKFNLHDTAILAKNLQDMISSFQQNRTTQAALAITPAALTNTLLQEGNTAER